MGDRIRGKFATRGRLAAFGVTAAIAAASFIPATASASAAKPATAGRAVAAAAPSAQTASALPAAYTPPKRTLKEGMSGADVKALQQRLAALKYYPGPADGTYGSDTLEAVWAFQEVNGLSVDGVVGPATKAALVHPRTYQARYPHADSTRVEVNLAVRVLVLYKDDKIALISHISAGGGYYFCSNGSCGYAITPTGTYRTTVYMPGWVQVPLGQMYNPVFFIGTVYAIHGELNSAVPVNPVSHGCVRIPYDIAQFFHNLVTTPGTEVIIYG
jgi:peptidoglycan hydrolase-like protein with peptidoglycan-binding domain